MNEKCLADELQEALLNTDSDDVFVASPPPKQSKVYPKFSKQYLEDLKSVCFNSVSGNTAPCLTSDNVYLAEDSVPDTRPKSQSRHVTSNARHLSAGSARLSSSDDADTESFNEVDQTFNSQPFIEAKEKTKCIALKEEMSELRAGKCASAPMTSEDRKRRGDGEGKI